MLPWEGVAGDTGSYESFCNGETKVGVLWHVTDGRAREVILRQSFASTSREIASHHLTAGTLSDASFGPDIQAQALSLIAPYLSVSVLPVVSRGSTAFARKRSSSSRGPLLPSAIRKNTL